MHLSWAKLMTRVFDIGVLACPKCKADRLQRIAFINSGEAIRKILTSMGEPTAPPQLASSREPEQLEMDWGA